MKLRFAILPCLLVVPCLPLQAEEDSPAWFARKWQIEEGLPSCSVTGVAQDANGYLWLARSLDEIVWAVNPSNDALMATANYLCPGAQEYLRTGKVCCRHAVEQNLPNLLLPSVVRHSLLLSVVEAMTNAIKHAQASEVWPRLGVEGEKLIVRVEDNGQGFDPSIIRNDRNGLGNMQRRCLKWGGQCLINSAPGKGATVQLTLLLSRFRAGTTSQ